MTLCLVAIFKNESHILEEFIHHYTKQGVDHLFFIDNGSTDNYMDIIKKFNNVTLTIDSTPYMQTKHYNKYVEHCKKYNWVLVCDLDEFVYSRLQFKTIPEYLNTLEDSISQVFIPWKMFGSSGYMNQPDKVIPHFTKRANYNEDNIPGVIQENKDKYSLTKCIVRTKYLKEFCIHSHYTTTNNYIGADNNRFVHPTNLFYKIDETILSNSYLHVNHYAIQSYDWFMRIKATRGDADNIQSNHVRNETYFKNYDVNDVEDTELKLL